MNRPYGQHSPQPSPNRVADRKRTKGSESWHLPLVPEARYGGESGTLFEGLFSDGDNDVARTAEIGPEKRKVKDVD